MRLQNIQDVKKDISYGAKDFGQLPEKYVENMGSIVRSYIEEINKFMKIYNDEFINIQSILQNAEEKQKYYFFKLREVNIMRNVCILAEKPKETYQALDEDINKYKRKLVIYEKIIDKCDKEFEKCINSREEDFKELFEINQEQALTIVNKSNPIIKIVQKLKNMFHGYEKFSKYVLQKHASKINKLKTETINLYDRKIKENIVNFSNEIDNMIEEF